MSLNEFSDYRKGMEDCDKGMPHKEGNGKSYDHGYSDQYQLEQIKSYIYSNNEYEVEEPK